MSKFEYENPLALLLSLIHICDYEEGWKFATKMGIPVVDEHYYNTPGWFINNQDFYDRYDRNKAKVYLDVYKRQP